MSAEKQPQQTNSGSALKQRRITELITPVMLPLAFAFTELISHIGCGTKGKLQALEQTINRQKETNKIQDSSLGNLNTRVQDINNKLVHIDTATKASLENQVKIDATQSENIDTVLKTNEEKKVEIEQLKIAVEELKKLTAPSSEIPRTDDDSDGKIPSQSLDIDQDQTAESARTAQNLDLDLELQNAILSLLEEYRKTLVLLPNFQTTLQVVDKRAVQAGNIIKKVLVEGTALTHSHKTRKTTRVTIPQDETFDIAETLRTIDEISPQKRLLEIDELIIEQKQKIQEMEETKNKDAMPSQRSDDSSDRDHDAVHTHGVSAENSQSPSGETNTTESTTEPRIIYYNNEETIYVPNDYEYDMPFLARARTGERLNSTYTVYLQEGEFAIAYGAYIQKSRSRRTYAMVCVSGPGAVIMHVASGVVDVFAKPQAEDANAWQEHKKNLIKAQIKNQQRYYPSFPSTMTEDYVYTHNHFIPDGRRNTDPYMCIEDLTGDNSQPRPVKK